MCIAPTHVAARTFVVELDKHRVNDEDRIFGKPRLWLDPEQQVFEWPRTQAREARIDPGRVAIEYRQIRLWRLRKYFTGTISEPVQTVPLVVIDCDLAEKLRHLAGRAATNEIHLEETILAVGESRSECEVEPAPGCYDRNTEFVAL